MRSQNDKATWSILRFDHRTFTAQLARMQRSETGDSRYLISIFILMITAYKGDGKIKESHPAF